MDPQRILYMAYAAVGAAAIGGLCIFLYVSGSFLLMRAHTTPRSVGALLRAALRETFWVLVTQPLVPLFYLYGRRMGGGGNGVPIVFVHGYAQNRANFVGLARALGGAGAPLYGFNYPWMASVEKNAARLGRFVERVCRETGHAQVILVAHSMGGLVCLEYMHTPEGEARVQKCVTIASPHAGVVWRGPLLGESARQLRKSNAFLVTRADRRLAVPTLSIYSTHDNVVHPPTTSALEGRGGEDRAFNGMGHLSILFDGDVSREVMRFVGAPPS